MLSRFRTGPPYFGRAILFAWLSFIHTSGFATSCYGLEDHFFIRCSAGSCQGEFRAREISGGGACGRRLVVEAIPENAVDVVVKKAKNKTTLDMKNGIFQISLYHRYYGKLPSDEDGLRKVFGEDGFRALRITTQKISAGSDIQKVRQDWQSRANEGLMQVIIYWVFESCIFLLAIIVVFKSVQLYRKRVMDYLTKRENHLRILGPLFLQVALFVVVVTSLLLMMELILFTLVIPLMLVVFPYELIFYVVYRFKRAQI